MDGIILINKPAGCTSYDIVRKVKKFSGEKKVGHGGTLDPAAVGVLVILTGEGCKISRMFIESEKTYTGIIRLGSSSTTGDGDGKITKEEKVNFKPEKIKSTVEKFRGKYRHRVPEYSSKKHKGRTFHSIKRSGKTPPRRKQLSFIKNIQYTGYDPPDIFFRAQVSSGTYIRTLAEDIARKLGTCGYLRELSRDAIGAFTLRMSVAPRQDEWRKGFINLSEALQKFPHVVVDEAAAHKISNGINFSPANILSENNENKQTLLAVFSPRMKVKALAEPTPGGGYNLKRVFNLGS